MPYKSQKQMAFMHAQHPGIAARWDKETKAAGKKFPTKKAATKRVLGKTAKKATPKRKGK